jgi:hypothetical protein
VPRRTTAGTIPAAPRWNAADRAAQRPRPGALLQRWRFTAEDDPSRRRLWLQEVCALVAGERLSPSYEGGVLAADMASALACAGDTDLGFISADYTLYVRRLAAGEFIGLE